MAAVTKLLINSIQELHRKYEDPRTENFLFMSSAFYPFCIMGVYYYLVRDLGPKLMKDRPPFKLKYTMLLYNIFQIICNAALFIVGWYIYFTGNYKFICQPISKPFETSVPSLRLFWLYFLLKIVDLLDTVFFILRKKEKQVTFLHIYHHAGMILIVWLTLKYAPDGHSAFVGMVNTGVHTVMYTYYLVSNWNPKYITPRMKKTVTQIQMLQFLIIIIHNVLAVLKEDCEFPKSMILCFLPHPIFMFFMFLDFYRKTYMKQKTQ